MCEEEASGSECAELAPRWADQVAGTHGVRDLGKLVIELCEPQFPQQENRLGEHPAPRAVLKVRCDHTSERVWHTFKDSDEVISLPLPTLLPPLNRAVSSSWLDLFLCHCKVSGIQFQSPFSSSPFAMLMAKGTHV